MLRAYASYAFQIGAIPSRQVRPTALDSYPSVGQLLFRLFEVRFDPDRPDRPEDRERKVAELKSLLTQELVAVSSLAHDRALRAFQTVILATIRTNYYRNGGRAPTRRSGGRAVRLLQVRLRAAAGRVEEPSSSTRCGVRSSRMEGIHLRGAAVARGGIRHSDRPDDFRTEVLGLVYTQVVKNALIVPSGSKGGFVCLHSSATRDEMAHEAREAVPHADAGPARHHRRPERRRRAARGDHPLRRIRPLPGRGRRQGDRPLLRHRQRDRRRVRLLAGRRLRFRRVQPDTTTRRSGSPPGVPGSRSSAHFREMGRNTQQDPFTVVGIGDMSGRRLRQRDAPFPQDPTRGGLRPPTRLSSTPIPTRKPPSRSASASSTKGARRGTTTTARSCRPGG